MKKKILEKMDRLSNLPESIICHIFSLLPTESVVRTSCLSKSWKDRWTKVTSFDFNNRRWPNKVKFSSYNGSSGMGKMNFVQFVDMVLQKQSPGLSIDRFSMILRNFRSGCFYLDKWIRTAVGRNLCVVDLEIDFTKSKYTMDRCGIQLPAALYTCETLEILKLSHRGVYIKVPSVVSLPKLRNLELNRVTYESGQSVNSLMLGCRRLQCIKIVRWFEDEFLEFVLSSPSLKSIDYYRNCLIRENKVLFIDTPLLESLSINQSLAENETVIVKGFPCLVNAHVAVNPIPPDNAVELLGSFVSVKILNLSWCTMLNVVRASKKLSVVFEKLVKLTVFIENLYHLNHLIHFIGSCPALETLHVHNFSRECQEVSWMEPSKVPICILSNMREVCYTEFHGKEIEFGILNFIWKHNSVLEKFEVLCSTDCCIERVKLLKKKLKLKESLSCNILSWFKVQDAKKFH